MNDLLALQFGTNPHGVMRVEPVYPIPPTAKDSDVDMKDSTVDDATIASLQEGVKRTVPEKARKRWNKATEPTSPWVDVVDSDTEDVPDSPADMSSRIASSMPVCGILLQKPTGRMLSLASSSPILRFLHY
eukprot:11496254-Heterocapsa_arctica.AAC.1